MLAIALLLVALVAAVVSLVVLAVRHMRLLARCDSLEQQAQLYQEVLRVTGAGVWRWNLRDDVWNWVEDVFSVTGSTLTYRIATGDEFYARLHPEDRARLLAVDAECLGGRQSLLDDYRYTLDSGEVRWLRDIGHLMPGDPPTMVGITVDITREKTAALAEARRLSLDELTGLPNRRALNGWLEERLADDAPLCLGFIDLNGFKSLNDRHGHAAGDRCLRAIGRALAGGLASDEFAARIGGDEFVVATRATDGRDVDRIKLLVHMAIDAARRDLQAGGVGAAVGLARHPEDATDAQALVSAADAAMYAAKATGRTLAFHLHGEAEPARRMSA